MIGTGELGMRGGGGSIARERGGHVAHCCCEKYTMTAMIYNSLRFGLLKGNEGFSQR